MNTIDKLIEELCPDGVEYVELGEIARIRNGKDYKHLDSGFIPVYGSGGVIAKVSTPVYSCPSVLIPRKGSLSKLYYVEEPFWTVDTIFYTEIDELRIVPKFFFRFMQTMRLEELNQAGGVPSLTQTTLNALPIPLPPLAIQREIVKILDTFSQLEAELEAELEARRLQYRHYRDELLSFGDEVEWRTLGEVFDLRAGKHQTSTSIAGQPSDSHPYPCFGGNGIRGYVSEYSHDGTFVLIGRQGALCGNVQRAVGQLYATEHAVVVEPLIEIDMGYAYHILEVMNLNQYATASAQPGLAVGNLKSIPIPIPPLAEQQRIVDILDTFDALVNDLSSGLPAEIAARRQQYEHYRDRLLTFTEKGRGQGITQNAE